MLTGSLPHAATYRMVDPASRHSKTIAAARETQMSDVDPERIRIMAEAARVPLRADAPARVARAVAPNVARFAAEKLALALETEPSTFIVVQRREIDP